MTASNLDYNRTIPPGSSLTNMGFNATYTGTNTRPTTFTLNGRPCAASWPGHPQR